ncbi:hypothetical protein HYH03_005116 [Edaphochlamys debaryana]|uniref:BTB domain-containing protein n=1 Tax=Edaphochlamys debaryana TaxID=47281 RepID=A0A835YD93_9CHLO|nr:hypothetical protein HYH03_005116 [Edaphochlamys debaryana]|eukprot:KAG2496700.1 hypothetical protein HYH03_005116 [Edaphochlamys debaryana]
MELLASLGARAAYSLNLLAFCERLYDNTSCSDCTIVFTVCGEALGPPLPGHKLVLQAASSHFAAMLTRRLETEQQVQLVIPPALARQPLGPVLGNIPTAAGGGAGQGGGRPAAAGTRAPKRRQAQRKDQADENEQPGKVPRKEVVDLTLDSPAGSPSHAAAQPTTPPVPAVQPVPSSRLPHVPVLRIALVSPAELPAALLAVRFAYAGRVDAGCVRVALEARRMGDYLLLGGCAEACDAYLLDALAAAGGGAEASGSGAALYQHQALWPAPEAKPSFAPVLAAARPQLLRHFGSTLATLNSPSLRQQLAAVPADALEALLESDGFGADTEDSVLVLLRVWVAANWARTDAAARQRLCGLVRLAQLSPAGRCVLTWLACDHAAKGPSRQAGWFPITPLQACHVSTFAAATAAQQRRMKVNAACPDWLKTIPRTPCIPPAGLSFPFSLGRTQLRTALADHAAAGAGDSQPLLRLHPRFSFGTAGDLDHVLAGGLELRVEVHAMRGESAAGVFVYAFVPGAYQAQGSSVTGIPGSFFPAWLRVRLTVHGWTGGRRREAFSGMYDEDEGGMVLGRLG